MMKPAVSGRPGVTAMAFEELVYVPDVQQYVERSRANGRSFVTISGTDVRERYLATGSPLPEWFTRPEVAALLRRAPAVPRGFCVWLMGLSGSGKSTIARALASRLEAGGWHATVLDGDVLRTTISKDLGFSRRDRDTNVLRIGALASDLVQQGHVVIGAVITPYAAARARIRDIIGADRFVLVHVDAPIDVCEQRDVKGLYARARRGDLPGLTGLDDPFERPDDASVHIDTTACAPDEAAARIVMHLVAANFVADRTTGAEVAREDGVRS